jgi:hypothetical protein
MAMVGHEFASQPKVIEGDAGIFASAVPATALAVLE